MCWPVRTSSRASRPICQKNFTAIHEQMHKEASDRIEAAGMSNDDAGAAWIMQTQALRL